jgi:dTDP-6-deoxy-L-talose 4-dehydrogenase (NAD+)
MAITGATGFIGRHVVADLERRGLHATIVTRNAGAIPVEFGGCAVVQYDANTIGAGLFDAIGRPDVLIHLAWGGLPNYTSRKHFEEELPSQYAFLKNLVMSGLTHCVITGTCLEYGMQSGELSEECPSQPATAYAFAKDSLRRQMEFLRADHPFALTWARLFYMYGEGQSKSSLYAQLSAAALRGDRTFDMSGGEQLRDYLPVQEVARLLVELALLGANAGVVNVCSGRAIRLRDLVEMWLRENRWALELNLGRYPYVEYEPMAFWGSRAKLERLIHA